MISLAHDIISDLMGQPADRMGPTRELRVAPIFVRKYTLSGNPKGRETGLTFIKS